MRRVVSAVAVFTCLAATGCGSPKTTTVNVAGSQRTLSLVITGPSGSLDAEVEQLKGAVASGGATATTLDGDQHAGASLCQTDVSDSTGTYHIAVYTDSTDVPASLCADMKSAVDKGTG